MLWSIFMLFWAYRIKANLGDYLNLVTPGDGYLWPVLIFITTIVVVPVYFLGLYTCMTYFTNYTTRKRTRDCDRLLFLHVLLCFFSFLVILAACAGSFVHWSSFKRRVQDGLWNVMQDYAVDRTSKMTMDTIQIEFQCCGSENFREWFYVPWAECTGTKEEYDEDETDCAQRDDAHFVSASVPFSCCSVNVLQPCIHHNMMRPCDARRNYSGKKLTIWMSGCQKKILFRANQIGHAVITILLGLALYQLALCIFTRCFHRGRKCGCSPEIPANPCESNLKCILKSPRCTPERKLPCSPCVPCAPCAPNVPCASKSVCCHCPTINAATCWKADMPDNWLKTRSTSCELIGSSNACFCRLTTTPKCYRGTRSTECIKCPCGRLRETRFRGGTDIEHEDLPPITSSSKKVNVVEEQDEDAEEEEEEEDDEEEDEEDDEEEEEGEEADQYKHQVDLHSTIKHSSSKVERTRERRVPSEMDRRKMLKMCREVNVEYKMSPHMLKRRAACDHPEDGFDDKHKTLKVKSSDVYGRFRGTLQDTMDRRESHRYEMAVKAPEYKKIKKSPHKVPVIPPHPPSLPPPPPYPYMYHSDWSKTEIARRDPTRHALSIEKSSNQLRPHRLSSYSDRNAHQYYLSSSRRGNFSRSILHPIVENPVHSSTECIP